MGTIGSGYDSECHLLRHLGRHRDELDSRVKVKISANAIK